MGTDDRLLQEEPGLGRAFVVARINLLRWIQDEPQPPDEVLKSMRDRAVKFNVEKIKQEDLAGAGGVADDQD